ILTGVVLLAGCSARPAQPGGPTATTPTYDVITVTGTLSVEYGDGGDMVRMLAPGGMVYHIKLAGILAPTWSFDDNVRGCDSAESALNLAQLYGNTDLGGSFIPPSATAVTDPAMPPRDANQNLVAYVSVVSRSDPTKRVDDLGLAQIEAGYAQAWPGDGPGVPARYAAYQAAQQVAQTAKLGAWAVCDSLGN
ncbi:MAG: hypothetical protein FWF28_11125, partial [Micrococcales bacterium]|nr:hypothetical protein [Micrococcales bacterium]